MIDKDPDIILWARRHLRVRIRFSNPDYSKISDRKRTEKYMGTVVLLRAILKGMGREVECEVIARKSFSGTRETVPPAAKYSNCSILTAPPDLPDGEYVIHLDSSVFPALRRSGLWL
jgi:hypothetical protein